MRHGVRRIVAAVVTTATTVVVTASTAAAQVPDPAPDASMPGAGLVTSLLGWLKWGALAAAVAGILGGGIAVGVGHFGNNYGAASAGRKWVLGGVGAAGKARVPVCLAAPGKNATCRFIAPDTKKPIDAERPQSLRSIVRIDTDVTAQDL